MISMVEALGVVLGEVLLHLGDQVGVVGAGLVEPEDRRGAGGAGPGDGELDPVADRRRPWSGRRARCRPARPSCSISTSPAALTTRTVPAAGISKVLSWEPYSSAALAIRPTLGTEPIVAGSKAPWARQSSIDGLVDAGVGGVRDHREGVGLLAVGAPHVAGGADHRRHRGVDDDVGRHVQVGDALVGVDHRQRGAVGDALLEGRLDRGAVRQLVEAGQDGAEPVVGGEARGGELLAVLREDVGEEGAARRGRR